MITTIHNDNSLIDSDDNDDDDNDDDNNDIDDNNNDDFKSIKIIDSKVPSKVKEWSPKSKSTPHLSPAKAFQNIFQNFDNFFIFIFSGKSKYLPTPISGTLAADLMGKVKKAFVDGAEVG